ncbi:PAS domain-containing protein [Caminibacter mediatlanticus]|uniref:PAS n=1 Tax=Caminibacter mediatlanticus TB-2 TaxID=391592 RepID=A0AAI9F2W7_9BACT|nr:PAS domain-containing protein [Caminibacter mediatlanticus]EDM24185.1 PAS [Caminibacter mediatlanticus TB-2]
MIKEERLERKLKSGKRLSKLDAQKEINSNEYVLKENDFIVSKTDTKGYITYCNRIFVEAAGWSRFELIGANHNIIRHPHMPKIAFKILWDLIQSKKEFFGFVKNLRKNGGFYWVFAYITPDLDLNGNIVGYTSFRKKPNPEGVRQIEPIYKELLEAEKRGGIAESYELLKKLLSANDENVIEKYHKLVFDLQKGI